MQRACIISAKLLGESGGIPSRIFVLAIMNTFCDTCQPWQGIFIIMLLTTETYEKDLYSTIVNSD